MYKINQACSHTLNDSFRWSLMGLMRKGVVDAMVSVVVVTFVIPNCQQSQL